MTTHPRPDPHIAEATFSSGQVLRAANIKNPLLQTWIRRGLIVGEGGVDMPGRPGIRRSFGFYTLIEIAVAAALTDLGLAASQAFSAAQRFAHVGEDGRAIAFPFPAGRTFLCVAGDRSVVVAAAPGEDVFSIARQRLGRPMGFVALDVSELFDRVAFSLDLHPQALLDAAYGDGEHVDAGGGAQ